MKKRNQIIFLTDWFFFFVKSYPKFDNLVILIITVIIFYEYRKFNYGYLANYCSLFECYIFHINVRLSLNNFLSINSIDQMRKYYTSEPLGKKKKKKKKKKNSTHKGFACILTPISFHSGKLFLTPQAEKQNSYGWRTHYLLIFRKHHWLCKPLNSIIKKILDKMSRFKNLKKSGRVRTLKKSF